MLGRRRTTRAVSAALARQRLDALESALNRRGPSGPTPDNEPGGADEANGAADDEADAEARLRPRGRHAAPMLVPPRSLALTAQQVTLVALAVAAVVAVAAWWVLRSAPHTDSVQLAEQRLLPPSGPATEPSAFGESDQPSGVAASAPPTSAEPSVVVDVAGKVRRPGIAELPAGSRVVDALRAAGGARKGVDTSTLNLARVLVDGEQIVVGLDVPVLPVTPAASAATGSTAMITPVNLNTATLEQLDTLPGVGPVTAQAILDWRTDNGAFSSVDELLEVSGIGDATLADLEAYVYV